MLEMEGLAAEYDPLINSSMDDVLILSGIMNNALMRILKAIKLITGLN